jgi:hypothetical protein
VLYTRLYSLLHLSIVLMKVRYSDVLEWERGQRNMCQVLGPFVLLDFTMCGPFSFGERFETYEPFISIIFSVLSGRGKLTILNQYIREHDYTQLCDQIWGPPTLLCTGCGHHFLSLGVKQPGREADNFPHTWVKMRGAESVDTGARL